MKSRTYTRTVRFLRLCMVLSLLICMSALAAAPDANDPDISGFDYGHTAETPAS